MRRTLVALLVSLLALSGGTARGQTVVVKLGTVAPDGSPWHLSLKEMGEQWLAESGGRVKLKIFPGGIQGNEGDMIRKMRVGQLQASAVTDVGLRDIDWGPQALCAPGLLASNEEFAWVAAKVEPIFEERLREKGFVVLFWGDSGPAHIFSKREARTPKDIQWLKVFAWSGDPGAVEAWREVGCQPVVVSVTDMLPALSTGMIEGFANTPLVAMTARWYERTPYMIEVPWGRLAGGTIMTSAAWEKIPADLRPRLLAIARTFAAKIDADVRKMGVDSVAAMERNGLKVIHLTEPELAEWQRAAEKTWPIVREKVVKPEDFDLVKRFRDEYRASKATK